MRLDRCPWRNLRFRSCGDDLCGQLDSRVLEKAARRSVREASTAVRPLMRIRSVEPVTLPRGAA